MRTRGSAEAAARELGRHLRPGQILLPGSPGYAAIKVWNSAVRNHAALVVRAEQAADVRRSVRAARAHHLPLSVLGGGHDWAGRALRRGGLVIDMSGMREIRVDAVARVATIGAGATSADVIAATAAHGLAAATGVVGEVGVTGLWTGGGYGPISGRVGLGLDNIVGADVVLANGELVTVDAKHDPDLFWAIRGGGGNFGVITTLRVRLHPLSELLVGFFLFPFAEATEVLSGLAEIMRTGPDDLTIQSGILPVEGAGATLFVSPVWSGEPAAGERYLDAVRDLGTPIVAQARLMPYTALLQLFDASIVPGRSYTIETRNVPGLLPEVIAAAVAAGNNRTSAASTLIIHHFHGAATRVPLKSTAFGERRNHLVFEIIGGWDPGDQNPARHRVWADQFAAALAPYALPGGYANLLGPHDNEQIAHAYGPNAARLRAVKRRYDPHGVFTAIPLPVHRHEHAAAEVG